MALKTTLSSVIQDRAFMVAWVIFAIAALLLVIITALRISPSDLQVPVQYTSFGVTNFYREPWYYLIGFAAFGVIVFALHSLVALKLYEEKGRELALPFIWISIGIIGIASFIIFALFRVVALSQ